MKTRPIVAARIDWAADGTPWASDFGDRYHAPVGAAAQARHVFLAGNELPGRWALCSDFCIVETGFGLGHNFLNTWHAWREDPARCKRLHIVAIDAHPPARADLERAHAAGAQHDLSRQLLAAWPPLVPGLHRLDFEQGQVQLLLALGDVRDLLPELQSEADACYLDGFAPAVNATMWEPRVIQALARRLRLGATAATWCVARALRDSLTTAGFDWQRLPGIGGKHHVLRARFAPRFPLAARRTAPTAEQRRAVVIGAGLAGACTAAALAAQGFQVQVLDRHAAPAGGSSGNPAGLFHATVHGDDSPYARLFRAGALHTARMIDTWPTSQVPRGHLGLLRLELDLALPAMQALIDRQGLPPDFVQALSVGAAGELAGVPLSAPAWFYPAGGWVDPGALVRALLSSPGVCFSGKSAVHAVRQHGPDWICLGVDGRPLASAPQLVLANAEEASPLLVRLGLPPLPLSRNLGQVTLCPPAPGTSRLRLPLAGQGYAIPLPDGGLLCGASTRADADADPAVLRDADHHDNLERLRHMCGMATQPEHMGSQGRAGWRVTSPDRLPLAGPVVARLLPERGRRDQARWLPREPGLHLACGFGGRGLTLAPLLGSVVAARIAGSPVPLEQGLIDSVDPARWLVRAARKAG
jgi:tRNA 5-methylaminomethyl-2-thiouridine biosynthesis bifunctional protein